MSLPTVKLANNMQKALQSGHPWVYRNHLPSHALASLPPNTWVRLEAGRAVAFGRYDAEGAIGVRIFSHQQVPDRVWIKKKVEQAVRLREPLLPITNAYRVIYGESDGLPGITADLYERYIIIKTYAKSVEDLLPEVARALHNTMPKVRGILHRQDGMLISLQGQMPPPELSVTERNLKLIANVYEGQKTGLFLDHRDNRQTISQYCQGKKVLNLFSYTGAFSLYADKGGASHVTSVDTAQAALDDAARNVTSNGMEVGHHTFLAEDCFKLLENYAKHKKSPFDVIICDPPSLARNKKQRSNAIRAYTRLNRDALAMLPDGGILATASCTAQIFPDIFKEIIANAAQQAGCHVQVLHEAGHALDHPVALHFPEGRYLKFVIVRKYQLL